MRSTLTLTLASVLASASACGSDVGVEQPHGGGGLESSPNCATGPFGGAMLEVAWPSNSTTYCVDRTEVPIAVYAKYVSAGGASSHDGRCSPFSAELSPPPAEGEDFPVQVSWCQADAFCRANGKRLCGDRAGHEYDLSTTIAPPDQTPATEAELGEWVNACSGSGAQPFAYGDAFVDGRCEALAPTASRKECEGGFPGLFDLAGNAPEHEAGCMFVESHEVDWIPSWSCALRLVGPLGCAWGLTPVSWANSPMTLGGIRCCSDVLPATTDPR